MELTYLHTTFFVALEYMSSKIFGYAHSAYIKAEKMASKQALILEPNDIEKQQDVFNMIFNTELLIAKNRFNRILDLSEELHHQFLLKYKQNWLFISIRPDDTQLTFFEFSSIVDKFVHRKPIKKFTLSYEQKGTSLDTLGQGFHCHIICDTSWRSKGEALRDTISSFKNVCAPNCIQIDKTKNPDEVIEKYLLNYESKDDHKLPTKSWDDLWRKNNGIQPLYTDENVEVHQPPVYQVQKTGGIDEDPFMIRW